MGNGSSRKNERDQTSSPRPESSKTPVQSQATGTLTSGLGESIQSQQQSNENPLGTDERTIEILRSTWSNDFDVLYQLGSDIYSEIFRLDPSTKNLFKALDGYDLEKDPAALKRCKAFGRQALRFIQTISMAVQNSGRLEQIDEYLKDIGRRHVQYKASGFKPEHWQVFETAIANVMESRAISNPDLNEQDRILLANAYKMLSRYVVEKMTIGFREEEVKGVQ